MLTGQKFSMASSPAERSCARIKVIKYLKSQLRTKPLLYKYLEDLNSGKKVSGKKFLAKWFWAVF